MKIKLTSILVDDQAKALKFYTEFLGFEQGIPLTAFAVDDIQSEYDRLKGLGVHFHTEPTNLGQVTIALFDDTCGNLIQLYQG